MGVGRLGLWSVLALVALGACSSGSGGAPATGPEARNTQAPLKKRRKVQPPPVLAPPPRYGNKIVEHTTADAPPPLAPADG
ncbi:MAG: hypothetical protein ABW217_21700 [Polyangiaceae bacterium]